MLAGLATGAYGAVASLKWNKKLLLRQAAGMLAGVIVLAGGYVLSSKITDAALMHYAEVQAGQKQVSLVAQAVAEEKQAEAQPKVVVKEARDAGDGTFTGRTLIWDNIFEFWKTNPKYFIIGNGVGRMSRDLLIGTLLENGGANMAHNAYIQFTMDLGLIGFVLLCAFLVLLVPPAFRVLLGSAGEFAAGSRAMCMLTIGCLVTGLMENEPLNAMRPCNVMLFFALAVIARAGIKRKQ
jgi:O-antigen ligase